MKFVPSNREDISRYFKNTFIKFKEFGDKLFLIQTITSDVISGTVSDPPDEFKLFLDEKEPYEVDYVLPHKSFFQYGNHAVLLERIPARQYFRGCCGNNTQATYVSGAGAVKKHAINFELLNAFVQKQAFPTLEQALLAAKKEGNEIVSFALSDRIAYYAPKNTLNIQHLPVARVNAREKIVFVQIPVFLEEITALMEQNKEPFKVMVNANSK
jgi:hypothetical protein